MTQQPTNPNFELLSAYLDDELSKDARTDFEARLAADPDLQAALDDLRGMVQVLNATPIVAVPRNFTLDPAKYRRPTPWWARYQVIRVVGAVGAFAAVILIAFGALSASLVVNNSPLSVQSANTAAAVLATNTQVQAQISSMQTAKAWTSTPLPTSVVPQVPETSTALQLPAPLPTGTPLPSTTPLPTQSSMMQPGTSVQGGQNGGPQQGSPPNNNLANGNTPLSTASAEKSGPAEQGAADSANTGSDADGNFAATRTASQSTDDQAARNADELSATMSEFAVQMTGTVAPAYASAPSIEATMPMVMMATQAPPTAGDADAAGMAVGAANEPSQPPTRLAKQTTPADAALLPFTMLPTATSLMTSTGTSTATPTLTTTSTETPTAAPTATSPVIASPIEIPSAVPSSTIMQDGMITQPTTVPSTPTPAATLENQVIAEETGSNLPRLLIIIGLVVLLLSAVLLSIGWTRARL